jgi:CHAD domain-containing protein
MGDQTRLQQYAFAPPPDLIEPLRALLFDNEIAAVAPRLVTETTPPLMAKRYALAEDGFAQEMRRYFDTFEWQLHKKGLVLVQTDGKLNVETLDGEIKAQAAAVQPPRFGDDLPEGSLKDLVAPLTGIRALLEQANVAVATRRFRLLNDDEKTVARLAVREFDFDPVAGTEQSILEVVLLPVRGYRKPLKAATATLQETGLTPADSEPLYPGLLERFGRRPGAYSAKPNYGLTPDMRADAAVKIILHALYGVMRANEAGIQADWDTEFLHDYRTAVRRTRSALSQIKGVFPAETQKYYHEGFRKLGQLTNELRDMDVYLLSRQDYRAMLPADLQPDIDPMFDFLEAKRRRALDRVVAGLQTDEYKQFIHEWAAFLVAAVPEEPSLAKAAQPISQVAGRRLLKRYRKLIDEGNKILETRDDKLMHALRIDGKKLRYLLEFFADILPPAESKALIKQLKRLQDNLGEFNDLTVQQAYLLHIAEELPLDKPVIRHTLVAIGILIEKLAQRQEEVRAEFAEIFAGFASPANQRVFARLLAATEEQSAS